MNTIDKVRAVHGSDEMITATMLLISLFNDCNFKSHIRFVYTLKGKDYEITFLPININKEHGYNVPTLDRFPCDDEQHNND